jgi:hypothetical protein
VNQYWAKNLSVSDISMPSDSPTSNEDTHTLARNKPRNSLTLQLRTINTHNSNQQVKMITTKNGYSLIQLMIAASLAPTPTPTTEIIYDTSALSSNPSFN